MGRDILELVFRHNPGHKAQASISTEGLMNRVVSNEEWIAARRELLKKEKEFNHLRDALSKQRRELPWEAVDRDHVFEGPAGLQSLGDLFDGRSQLIIYHFMF